jgi:hypothetical protein
MVHNAFHKEPVLLRGSYRKNRIYLGMVKLTRQLDEEVTRRDQACGFGKTVCQGVLFASMMT